MSNQSDLTRKDQVLYWLRKHANQWVDGPDLSNERIGGSEGLRRLRELTHEGHRIQQRRHPEPSRDIWQYRLVTEAVPPLRSADVQSSRMSDAVKQHADGSYEYVAATPTIIHNPVVDEGPIPEYQFTVLPEKIDFGTVAVCPRCHARTRKHKYGAQGKYLHKDPYRKMACLGCGGWGIVPNKGPIPATMPEGAK